MPPVRWDSGRLHREGLTTTVTLQALAVAGAVVLVVAGRAAFLALLPVMLAALILVCLRVQGRWGPRWLGLVLAYRRRRARVTSAARRGVPALDVLLRGASISTFTDRTGTEFGVVRSGRSSSLTLGLEPGRADAMLSPPGTQLPLQALPWVLAERDIELSEARLVVHESGGQEALPASCRRRLTWLCLSLDPASCPGAVQARGGGVQGGRRALTTQAARLAVRCGELGLRLVPFDVERLGEAVALCSQVPTTSGRAAGPPCDYAETWYAWTVDGRAHVTFWVDRMPRGLTPDDLLDLLAGAPVESVTVALAVRRAHDRVHTRMLVRLCCEPPEHERLEADLAERLAPAGVRLLLLRGQQLAAAGETLPAVLT